MVTNSMISQWLVWARKIQALAQTGHYYAENDYQRERYRQLSEIAAEIISQHTGLELVPLVQTLADQTGYATPRVDVRAAVFQQGKPLLVRERSDGGWTLPGGWADVGDVPSQAAERRSQPPFPVNAPDHGISRTLLQLMPTATEPRSSTERSQTC